MVWTRVFSKAAGCSALFFVLMTAGTLGCASSHSGVQSRRTDKEQPSPERSIIKQEEAASFDNKPSEVFFSSLNIPGTVLKDPNISSLLVENHDLWIGTWNGGFIRYDLLTGQTLVLQESSQSIAPQTVRALSGRRLSLWVGTYNGLYQFWKPNEEWQPLSTKGKFSTQRIQDLTLIGEDVLISTLGWGVWRLREKTLTPVQTRPQPGKYINLVRENPEGTRLYLGAMNNGLWYQDRGETGWSPLQGSPANITTLSFDSRGHLWVGSYGEGIGFYDSQTKKWKYFTRENRNISNNWILSSLVRGDFLYFGTFGGGLMVYNKVTGLWYNLSLSQGLPSLDISSIQEYDGRLYLGTLGKGVSIFEADRWEAILLKH